MDVDRLGARGYQRAQIRERPEAGAEVDVVPSAHPREVVLAGCPSGGRARMAGRQLGAFHGLIGRSAPMQALYRCIERAAAFNVPVLILGESGTGKELVARGLYELSARRGRPFGTINAGALTRELLLSELFGHERGAFTGAIAKKAGLLSTVDGGTVFLDEIGDIPLDAQVMLLRFLQDGEIRPIGSTTTRRADVRVIAATHRHLAAAVDRGTFREDLFYRLQRVVLEVPALRERREDIPLLAEHVCRALGTRHKIVVRGLTREALDAMERYAWPGNVRELEAKLEQAAIFKRGEWISVEDLRLPSTGALARSPAAEAGGLSWLQRQVLRIADERRELRHRDVTGRYHVSRDVASHAIAQLVRGGLLRRVGSGRGARYVRSERGRPER